MPKIIFISQDDNSKVEVTAKENESILDAALSHNIKIEHACEKSCACTTCHVVVKKGFSSLEPATELEEYLLDKAWGFQLNSRLSCQVKVASEDLEVEIPKYTINQVSENH